MKKFLKALAVILAMALMMTAVTGCTSDEDEDVDSDESQVLEEAKYAQYDGDVYAGTYEFNGNDMEVIIILGRSDTFRKITNKNGDLLSDITGEYEWVEEDELRLYENSSSCWTYKHNNGVLKNNDHEFKKVKSAGKSKEAKYSEYDGAVYVGEYEYNGNDLEVIIILQDEISFRKITNKNGTLLSDITGEYEWVEEDEIRLYENSSSWWTYMYSDGVLRNNNHEFKRVK